jgi:hypothetical protein
MNSRRCLICVLMVWLSGFAGAANAREVNAPAVQRLKAGPVQLHIQAGEKPIVMFSSPCMLIAQIDRGFPPTTVFREMMVNVVLATNFVRPFELQPVCM